jgi:hypothetical protein
MKISSCKGVKPIPRRYSRELQDLVDDMLVADPDKRPAVNKILKRGLIKERVKRYLNANEFEEEFSHTILHNEYLFDMRKKRAKPVSNPILQSPSLPKPLSSDKQQKIPMVNQVAPLPKPRNWVNESPRAQKAGFIGHRPLSSNKKDSASKLSYRPYSAKLGSNQDKTPSSKKTPRKKGLVIQGEEIKPVIAKNDGKRKVSDMFEENKISKEYDKYDQKIKDRAQQIDDKVKNIYKLDKSEEEKVLNNNDNYKPHNFADKPLAKQLGWMKPSDHNMESSKENTPFIEESKEEEIKAKAKQKIDNYRKSIIKMLDSESDEEQIGDGLETNREVSDEDDREDDNIMEGTGKSVKGKLQEREKEKDLTLDIDSEPEMVIIHGDPYFKKCGSYYAEPLYIILKAVIIDQFGVENTEKGIEFVKSKGNEVYIETNKSGLITEFRENCFNESDESILDFISTVSSLVSYN